MVDVGRVAGGGGSGERGACHEGHPLMTPK